MRTLPCAALVATILSTVHPASALCQGRVITQFPYVQSFAFVPSGTATTPSGPIGTAVFPSTDSDGGEFVVEAGTSTLLVNGSTTGLNNNVGAGGAIRIQTSGNAAPTTSQGFIVHLSFTNRFAESLSLDWTKVANGSSTRVNELRVAVSANNEPFAELASVSFDNTAQAQSGTLTIALPSDLDGERSVRFRIYSTNVSGSGAHPRVVVDNLYVSAPEDSPLPVELASYSASYADNTVRIAWRTASEHNNAGFEVLRAGGSDSVFLPIASYLTNSELRGLGTSSSGRSYQYDDRLESRAEGATLLRYRLVDVAIDGTRKDNGQRTVLVPAEPSPSAFAVVHLRIDNIVPVPAGDALALSWTQARGGRASVDVYNARGMHILMRDFGDRVAGLQTADIDVSSLARGGYVLALCVDGIRRTRGFVITR